MENLKIQEMMMTKKYEIALNYIKDLSVEIPDAQTFIFSKEYITKYSLGINVTTKGMKNDMIEVITKYPMQQLLRLLIKI